VDQGLLEMSGILTLAGSSSFTKAMADWRRSLLFPRLVGSAFSTSGNTAASAAFTRKPVAELGWINGGFFVLEPGVMDFIDGDDTIWEQGPLQALAAAGQLVAFRHSGFWKPMDTLCDKWELEGLWSSGAPSWEIW